MEPRLGRQAGFQISDTVKSFWRWPAHPPTRLVLQYQTTSFGATSKPRHMKQAVSILTTLSSEFPKEMLQLDAISFPLRVQGRIERHSGQV
jgi:hypothetical protein